jgi:hypothetical protein
MLRNSIFVIRATQANVTAAAGIFGNRDGYWLTACYAHEETCRDLDFFDVSFGG